MTEYNKDKIGISIDHDLLTRIDAVCEAKNEARSAWFERIARNSIQDEEQFVADMENPLIRGVVRAMIADKHVLALLAKAFGENSTPEQLERIQRLLPRQIELGKERQAMRKGQARRTPRTA